MEEVYYQRTGTLVSLLLLGLALSCLIRLPTNIVSFVAFGSPTTLYVSTSWIMGGMLLLLTMAGVYSLVHSQEEKSSPLYSLAFTGLPSVVILIALFFLRLLADRLFFVLGLASAGLLLTLILVGQYHTMGERNSLWARWGLDVVVYGAAIFFYALIYGLRTHSPLSASGVSLVSGALALELLRYEGGARRTWLYALVVGLIMGEVVWVLNYWGISALAGGSLLLLVFYLFTGLARQYLEGVIGRRVVVEFLLLAFLSLALLGWLFSWSW
ncbi:MAG TPA: hypothetical protein DCP08_05110 [Chloroflexi bacterium]|nr:hypothetical protein [Chloroflexota bacterium]